MNVPYRYTEHKQNMFPTDEDGYYLTDKETRIPDTWHAMEDLIDMGLCKSAGISNFNIQQVRECLACVKKHRPQVLQNECHPYYQQKDIVDFCKINNIVFQSYSPLV